MTNITNLQEVFSELDLVWFHRKINETAKRIQEIGPMPTIAHITAGIGDHVREALVSIWTTEKWPLDVQPSMDTCRVLAAKLLAGKSHVLGHDENERGFDMARAEIESDMNRPRPPVVVPTARPAVKGATSGSQLFDI
jgi:hypothetical protein